MEGGGEGERQAISRRRKGPPHHNAKKLEGVGLRSFKTHGRNDRVACMCPKKQQAHDPMPPRWIDPTMYIQMLPRGSLHPRPCHPRCVFTPALSPIVNPVTFSPPSPPLPPPP